MNRRKKEWKKQVDDGKQKYENEMNMVYDYYGELNRRHHIKSTKGLWYWIRLIIRFVLGISLMVYTLSRILSNYGLY